MKDDVYSRIINADWTEVVDEANADSKLMPRLYVAFKKQLLSGKFDENTLRLSTCLLENNNILFHSCANYKRYQDVSFEVFKRFSKASSFNDKELFYRYCFAAVYSDYFKNRKKGKSIYEDSLKKGLRYFQNKYRRKASIQALAGYILALIHMSQHCLFKGDLKKNRFFLNKVYDLLKRGRGLNSNYKAFFYYHYSWSFFETDEHKKSLSMINRLLNLKFDSIFKPIVLHAMNIKCAMLYSLGKYDECFDLANIVFKNSKKVFSASNQDVFAESLLNIAKCLIKKGNNLQTAKDYARKAISVLKKLFLGESIDVSQALANIILGEAYQSSGNENYALNCFETAKEIYESVYQDLVKNNVGYLGLLDKIQELS